MQSLAAVNTLNEPLPLILIVDGDPDTRLLYRTALADLAAVVVEAEDGAEAFGKAICQRPDVILTETRLRRIDGYALCTYLRRDQTTRSSAIVVVTSAAHPAEIARATRAGADEVLVKPCLPDTVVEAAYRSWRRRREWSSAAQERLDESAAGQ